jgi:hypothetical protein
MRQHYKTLKSEKEEQEKKLEEERLKNQSEIDRLTAKIAKLQNENYKFLERIDQLSKMNESCSDRLNVNVLNSDTEDIFADDEPDHHVVVKQEQEFNDDSEVICGQLIKDELDQSPECESPRKRRSIFGLVQDCPDESKSHEIGRPTTTNVSLWLSKSDLPNLEQENAVPKQKVRSNGSFVKTSPSSLSRKQAKLKQSKLDFSSKNILPIVSVEKTRRSNDIVDESPNHSRRLKRKNSLEELFNFVPRMKQDNELNPQKTIDENETFCPDLSTINNVHIKTEPRTQEKREKKIRDDNENIQLSQSSDVIFIPGKIIYRYLKIVFQL